MDTKLADRFRRPEELICSGRGWARLTCLAMSQLLLYSTNPWVSHWIGREYRAGVHHAWCSESFDSQKLDPMGAESLVPPSANPVDLYRAAAEEVRRGEKHSVRITRIKALLLGLAIKWERAGELSAEHREEIVFRLAEDEIWDWRPLLYVIPRTASIESRIIRVPPQDRAGIGPEYKIQALRAEEFDIVEF